MDYLIGLAHQTSAILKTRPTLEGGMLTTRVSLWYAPRCV